jgi:hypothetical protein
VRRPLAQCGIVLPIALVVEFGSDDACVVPFLKALLLENYSRRMGILPQLVIDVEVCHAFDCTGMIWILCHFALK